MGAAADALHHRTGNGNGFPETTTTKSKASTYVYVGTYIDVARRSCYYMAGVTYSERKVAVVQQEIDSNSNELST